MEHRMIQRAPGSCEITAERDTGSQEWQSLLPDELDNRRQLNDRERKCAENYNKWHNEIIFTARRYASAVYAIALCPSVSVSVPVCVCHTSVFYQNG